MFADCVTNLQIFWYENVNQKGSKETINHDHYLTFKVIRELYFRLEMSSKQIFWF